VTRKITLSLARIRSGKQAELRLGNMDARRDWGYAKDYVEMMWLILQQDEPDDYVAATGEMHTVREFVQIAAERAGFDLVFEGEGVDEVGRDRNSGRVIVCVDPEYYRPVEVDVLLGDATKARTRLEWRPKVTFQGLVELIMDADLKLEGVA